MNNSELTREYKKPVPAKVVKTLKKAIAPYGAAAHIARIANVSRTAVTDIVTTKMASPSILEKVQKALKEAA